MADTAADVLIDTLHDWGVEVVFGLPGDGINGIMEALRKRQDKIRFVQVRHEESAAFMACGYAKYTGKLGVCLATSGPGRHPSAQRPLRRQARRPAGARHHRPSLPRPDRHARAAGRRPRPRLHGRGASTTRASWAPAHVENVADLACRTALGLPRRGPHHLPGRPPGAGRGERALQAQRARHTRPTSSPAARGLPRRGRPAPAPPRCSTPGSKVAILAGRGALQAHATSWSSWPRRSARRSSRRCSARRPCPTTAPTPPAASACSARSPSQEAHGGVRHAADGRARRSPTSSSCPKPGQARGVQIDLDPTRIGLRYPVEVGLVGDSRRTLQALLPLLERNEDRELPREGPGGHDGVAGADGGARHPRRTSR